ncbi:MAG: (d)CMP kinase [Terrimicrobiaceae bacterium]|nr:(d)CMP kinase [Terrimicrobiaceae bacterium]
MTVIAIDGPAASGKSSVARGLAQQLGFSFINTGAMYRAAAWHVLNSGADPHSPASVTTAILAADIRTGFENRQSFIEIGGRRPYEQLRDEGVNRAVSAVASVPAVRERLVREFRTLARFGDCVVEGRDIGSVVFPDSPCKFYLDASPEVRQFRRNAQGQRDEVAARDRIDSSRRTAPLTIAPDATVIDTTELGLDEVMAAIRETLLAKGLPACQRT